MGWPMNRFALLGMLAVASGCAGTIESAVNDAQEHRRYPAGMSVVYDDRAPLLGGDRIEIAADGQVRWWVEAPSPLSATQAPEDAFDDRRTMAAAPDRAPDRVGVVDDEARVRLADLVATIAPWESPRDSEDDSRLERRRAFLETRIGSNVASSWQWADATEIGDERITSVRRWAETAVHVVQPEVAAETSGGEAPEAQNGPNPVLR